MIRLLKNNKYVFFVAILVLILLVLVIFTKPKNKENSSLQTTQEAEFVGSYEVLEKSGEKFVENKEANLTFKVPDDWIIKNYGSKISFFSSEINLEDSNFLETIKQENICSIIVGVKRYLQGTENLNSLIKNIEEGGKKDYYEVILVAGQKALKTILRQEGGMSYVSVDLPLENNIYSFGTGLIFSENCLEGLDNFLKTVEIK